MSLTHLTLACGRTTGVADIRLTTTYGDMLESYPFSRLNDMKLSSADAALLSLPWTDLAQDRER
ncbi:hypothetical protein AB0D46_00630 [Streptomyces sp. NPDC048383]|uniref:hypothetical protein n=1 Tax=Streptomyces sp. NPDC048383 TaxID=3155386 RepID=UPI0034282445